MKKFNQNVSRVVVLIVAASLPLCTISGAEARGGGGGGGGFHAGGGGGYRGGFEGGREGFGDRGFGDRGFGDRGFGDRGFGPGGYGDRGFGDAGRAADDLGRAMDGSRAGGDMRNDPLNPGNWNDSFFRGGDNGVRNYGSLSAAGRGVNNFGFDRLGAGTAAERTGNYLHNYTPSYYADRAAAVRAGYRHWDAFWGDRWWDRYPGCWYCPGWGYDAAWDAASWDDTADLMGLAADTDPDYYGYGETITYNGDNVYYNSQPVATTTDYYNQAQQLAASGNATDTTSMSTWKPLGVYALTQGQQTDTSNVFQLAVDSKGDIGGNYYNPMTDQTTPVTGKVDKKNQRVAWTVGNNRDVVYDTGLGNLMANQAPLLVHFGKDHTEQWTLVKLQRPTDGTVANQSAGAGTAAKAGASKAQSASSAKSPASGKATGSKNAALHTDLPHSPATTTPSTPSGKGVVAE